MNITVLTFEQALASAAARKPMHCKSEPHIRAAQTRRENKRANDPILREAGL